MKCLDFLMSHTYFLGISNTGSRHKWRLHTGDLQAFSKF